MSKLQTVVCSLNTPEDERMSSAIAYYRVSTRAAGPFRSGHRSTESSSGSLRRGRRLLITHESTEVETGMGTDALDRRPRLTDALAAARKDRCPAVAKLDRRSRDAAFIAG